MKKYLKDLTNEELQKVYEVNSKLQEDYCQKMYEQQMDAQLEEGNMLLDNARKYFEICDNYDSFFLRLKDGIKLLENLNFEDLHDYSIITDAQIEECKKMLEDYATLVYNDNPFLHTEEEMSDIEDKMLELEEKINEIAKVVLGAIEKYLHTYEDVDYENAFTYFMEDLDLYSDLYITSEDYVAYEDYTRCYK